jgi:WD40 repeat protein
MNAHRDDPSLLSAIAADPLASAYMDRTAIADLAFGSFSKSRHAGTSLGRHLALLAPDSLELDLTDPAQRKFGDYELLEMIGEGGMGVVYRARQHSLDRDVAVKLLAAGPWASNEFIERFRREAQNAARMQHPNIVAIYEVGSAEELHFFSMRLIRGGSLSGLLKRDGKLAPARAAQLLRTVAEAVDYAHRLGVLHLDLKPANVLLDDNGAPHVADFGLARRFEQDVTADNTEVSGTPSYMAPEQATAGAQKITPATDIWGLGAVLYELVTGQPPFLGDSPQAILKLVVSGSIKNPRQLVPEVPRDLEAIILKCMSREISTRYPSGRALADDLGRFLENRPVQARALNPAQRTWRAARRQPYLAAFAALFAISLITGIIGVGAQWRRAEGNAQRAEASAVRATTNEAISNQRLWEGRRDTALRQLSDGKGFEALPALIANIDEQEKGGKSGSARVERREIGMILGQGMQLIDRMIVPDAPPLAAEIAPDGGIFALGLADLTVRWYDSQSMTELGRVDLRSEPTSGGEELAPMWLRFVDARHLLVTMEWPAYLTSPNGHDTYLIDLERGRILAPPVEFRDFTNAVFSDDARYALLFNHENEFQAWQVNPWRPLSRKAINPSGGDSWMVGRDGKFAINTAGSPATHVFIYDLHDLSKARQQLIMPSTSVTAWAESARGGTVAIGDNSGYVYLIDMSKPALRQLATPAGFEVTWLAFSEDDAWLAAVRRDGAIFAFDVASGRPLNAGQMREDFDTRQVAISHRDRLLVASGLGESAPWRLPLQGPQGQEAHRLIARPTTSARAGTHAVGTSLQHGLLLTANRDGEVRLWRAPPPNDLSLHASSSTTEVSDNFSFDGTHVVDIDDSHARVVSVRDGSATAWADLPQPVAFAELFDHARCVFLTSGATLQAFDAISMTPRFAPVTLPASPLSAVVAPDGKFAVLAFGHNGPQGFEEQLRSYDLETGQSRGEVVLQGALRQLQLSDDAQRLVAVGPQHGATHVLEPATLKRLGSYPHDADHPVQWASFLPDTTQLWLLGNSADEMAAREAQLIRWDVAAQTVLEKRSVGSLSPIGLFATTGKPLLATSDQILLDPGTDGVRSSVRLRGGESSTRFALSHDRSVIAHIYGHEVRLYDAATLVPVGAPLQSFTPANDMPLQVAFAANDEAILGLTGGADYLLWQVPIDNRPLDSIRVDADLLSAGLLNLDSTAARLLQMPGTAQRASLRHRDPGSRHVFTIHPPAPPARLIDGLPVPPRAPQTNPLLLDLTSIYNVAPGRTQSLDSSVLPIARHFPLGIAHLDGIDYDIRGALEMRTYAHGGVRFKSGAASLPSRVSGIAVPAVAIAALHVLMYAPLDAPVVDARTYCTIHVHYLDGSTAALPIRIQHEVAGGSDRDQIVPVAWSQSDHLRLIGILKQMLIGNPRLANPHPEKIIASLDIETSEQTWNEPIFFAITAEPVISAANSGTKD